MKKLLIYGAGGNGEVCADIAKRNGYDNILFFDDNESINKLGKYNVIHNMSDINENEYDYFNAIGDNRTRELVSNKLNKKLVTLIHPTAVIGENVNIGEGCVIMANTVINPGCKIGKGVIINTCASVDHDNTIGNYTHISVNSHLAGNVHIGERTFVGINSTVINNVNVGSDIIIGASSTVVNDINEIGTYIGTPAKLIK